MFAQSLEAFIDGLWLNILIYPGTFTREQAKQNCHTFLANAFPDHFDPPEPLKPRANQ